MVDLSPEEKAAADKKAADNKAATDKATADRIAADKAKADAAALKEKRGLLTEAEESVRAALAVRKLSGDPLSPEDEALLRNLTDRKAGKPVALAPDQEKIRADLAARKEASVRGAAMPLNPAEDKQLADLTAQKKAFDETPVEIMRVRLQAMFDRKVGAAHDVATKQGGFQPIVITAADAEELMAPFMAPAPTPPAKVEVPK